MGKENLDLIAREAVRCESLVPGVPGDLIAAQCIIESAWLTKAPGKNCFGVKSYMGEYGRQLLYTYEWFTDKECKEFLEEMEGRTAEIVTPQKVRASRWKYHVQDWFATFATLADCFAKRAGLFKVGRYAPFFEDYQDDGNLEKFVRAIAPIYATDPDYGDQVMKLIKQSDVQAALGKARLAANPPKPLPSSVLAT